jgi:hypothetical protein
MLKNTLFVAGSICLNDGDCLPAAGGRCISPNTGMSCLHDYQCTYQGICNGSLYNLSMTPPPEPPPMEVPFEELSDAGTLLGGTGKFLNVLNFSFGFVTFQINEPADGVLCYNIRNKEQEKRFIREAHGEKYITDLRLVNAMSTYISARTLTISMPEVRCAALDTNVYICLNLAPVHVKMHSTIIRVIDIRSCVYLLKCACIHVCVRVFLFFLCMCICVRARASVGEREQRRRRESMCVSVSKCLSYPLKLDLAH